jgi:hypothetical protein
MTSRWYRYADCSRTTRMRACNVIMRSGISSGIALVAAVAAACLGLGGSAVAAEGDTPAGSRAEQIAASLQENPGGDWAIDRESRGVDRLSGARQQYHCESRAIPERSNADADAGSLYDILTPWHEGGV